MLDEQQGAGDRAASGSTVAFGQRLQTWRLGRELPLKRVAHDLNVSTSIIESWEHGTESPTIEHLEMMSKYTGIPICGLVCPQPEAPDSGKSCACRACAALARHLSRWRRAQQLPLREVARLVDVSISAVSAWEQGERFPSGAHLDRLSSVTGMPICGLLYHGEDSCPSCQDSSPPDSDTHLAPSQ